MSARNPGPALRPGPGPALRPGPVPAALAERVRALAAAGAGVAQQRAAIAALLEAGIQPDAATVIARLAGEPPPAPSCAENPPWVTVVGHAGYPARLTDAWPELGAPVWLFGDGPGLDREGIDAGLPALARERPAVAIVGTRHPTADGLRTAHDLARACAAAGATVVSGLARGIDQAAHRGALAAGGATVAVLGTGIGVDYPRGDVELRTAITRSGGLVTELAPGTPPRPAHFLARNRIIAGLADVTVVVEGRARSGALHTARMAASQGRDVWAVPGSLNAPISQAPLALIRDGASVVTAVDDVLGALGLARGPDLGAGLAQPALLDDLEDLDAGDRDVARLLGAVPVPIDEIVSRTGHDVASVLRSVGRLCRRGFAVRAPDGIVAGPDATAAGHSDRGGG